MLSLTVWLQMKRLHRYKNKMRIKDNNAARAKS